MKNKLTSLIFWLLSICLTIGITFFCVNSYYSNSDKRALINDLGKEKYETLTTVEKHIETTYYFNDGNKIVDETSISKDIHK